jgi:hypothetical protein
VLADPMCSTTSVWVSERKHYDVFSRRSVHILTRLSPPLNSICLSLRIGAKSKSWATLAARMIMVLKPFYRKWLLRGQKGRHTGASKLVLWSWHKSTITCCSWPSHKCQFPFHQEPPASNPSPYGGWR